MSAKSRSLGLAYSAGQVGNIVALLISPLLIKTFGWQSAFWVYGTLGLTWMLAWVPLVPDQPPNKTNAAKEEGGRTLFKLPSQPVAQCTAFLKQCHAVSLLCGKQVVSCTLCLGRCALCPVILLPQYMSKSASNPVCRLLGHCVGNIVPIEPKFKCVPSCVLCCAHCRHQRYTLFSVDSPHANMK